MKKLKYILLAILPLFAFYGCESDDADNPTFGDQDLPHIYVEWVENMAYKVGDTVKINPQVSPSDGAIYKWTLGGKVISTERDLKFAIKEYMVSELKFEVSRNGVVNSRVANLLVPQAFVPKVATKKKIAYLSQNGRISDVDWENITHIIYSSAVVSENGTLDNVLTTDVTTLTAFAHHYGVFSILQVSGPLGSYMTGAAIYDSRVFYNQAVGASQGRLIDNIIAKAKTLGVDGIDVLMDKSINPDFPDPVALKSFYENLGTKFKQTKNIIEGTEYDYILSMSVYGGWTRGALAGVVNIPTYDWMNILAFGAEDLTPTPHSSPSFAMGEVNTWTGWLASVNPNRVVLVVPAFGLRYFGKPSLYTWGNLWQFTEYHSYADICKNHADAPAKNEIVIKDTGTGDNREVDITYYDGFPAIQEKIDFAKTKGLAGIGLWSIESDSKDPSKALMKKINTALGN